MFYENYEKYSITKYFILNDNNCDNASVLYFNRCPKRRQSHKSAFAKLKENIINQGSIISQVKKIIEFLSKYEIVDARSIFSYII